ncbi:MAG: DedA family protein [Anaerolineales bacterium]|jgi:membrane-associated protein|nr:DedA family protein [Anaerolineales bacterium]
MEFLSELIALFLHLDTVLADVIRQYGTLTYAFLFAVIFLETGLVVTPFLPGDSLLFAAGALSVTTDLSPFILFLLLSVAAVLGDAANYTIGHKIGARAFDGSIKILKKEYLDKTHAFYEKHGNKTIVLARFVPIVRTFAPFVAGVGKMTYWHFATYNIIGGVVWVALFTFAGYFFGEIPFVKENFEFVVIAIILVSILPGVFEWWKARRANSPA